MLCQSTLGYFLDKIFHLGYPFRAKKLLQHPGGLNKGG
jgi:hypothetical protein